MSSLKSYSIGLVVSVLIHGNILAALVFAWEPKESPVIIIPNQIEASLVQLTANPKVSEDIKVQKKQKKKKKNAFGRQRLVSLTKQAIGAPHTLLACTSCVSDDE